MDVTAYRRFLSTTLSENGNGNAVLCYYRDFDSCICYHCGCYILLYPYWNTQSVAEMEQAVGILRLHGYRFDKEMCIDRNCFYGIFHFNDSGKSAVYSSQTECGKLVDSDKRGDGVSVFLL